MDHARGWRPPAGVAAHEFLAQLVEQLPHPIFVKDREFRYVLMNDALVRMSGQPVAAMLGKTDYDFLSKERSDFYRAKDVEVFSSAAEVAILEEELIDGAGRQRVLSTRKVPLRDAAGEITHLIGIISDITDLKAVQEALRNSSDQLEERVADRTRALALAQDDLVRKERLAVLGRLAGGVAHQIRNPLGAIKNAAYVLRRRVGEVEPSAFAETAAEEVSHSLEIIHDEVQRANKIITDLLDYARVRVPVRRITSVADVIDDALRAHDVPSTIRIERIVHDVPNVAVDADQLAGALFNVLHNAFEAMPNGGTLTIEATVRDASIVVSIGDTGTGMPASVRARLFEPLVTTKALGLGLGLVTARTLVEGQGGSIRCVSSDHRGTRFELTVPSA
ncbi:MAG: sensor histidine kinase [Labilithrix sp.]|nr:sensor histidine kinase [Labilithrix sp.]